jgi:hypothetical protein
MMAPNDHIKQKKMHFLSLSFENPYTRVLAFLAIAWFWACMHCKILHWRNKFLEKLPRLEVLWSKHLPTYSQFLIRHKSKMSGVG